MKDPEMSSPKSGRGRIVVLAALFALFAHGCFVAAVSLSVSPF